MWDEWTVFRLWNMQLLPKQRDLYDSMFSFVNSICAINCQQRNEISLWCIRAGNPRIYKLQINNFKVLLWCKSSSRSRCYTFFSVCWLCSPCESEDFSHLFCVFLLAQAGFPLTSESHEPISIMRLLVFLQYFYPDPFLDIDDCVNHACSNGASCVDGINNYSCNCKAGFTGGLCKTGR